MPPLRSPILLLVALAMALGLAGCADDGSSTPTTAAAPAASCAREDLDLVRDGVLTVGTDSPAFPPYVLDDDPSSGRGFESALAYGIADWLGFARGEVRWTVVPFRDSHAPGPKDADLIVNQVSITAERARQVDFSEPYYTTPQAVLVPEGSPYAGADSVDELRAARFGVQEGTTSQGAVGEVIMPRTAPRVLEDSDATVRALRSGRVDAIVVDLPTALQLRDAEIPGSTVVGQFPAPGGDDWGVVLRRGSALTPCVHRALAAMRASGELRSITEEWIGAEVPVLSLD